MQQRKCIRICHSARARVCVGGVFVYPPEACHTSGVCRSDMSLEDQHWGAYWRWHGSVCEKVLTASRPHVLRSSSGPTPALSLIGAKRQRRLPFSLLMLLHVTLMLFSWLSRSGLIWFDLNPGIKTVPAFVFLDTSNAKHSARGRKLLSCSVLF